MNSWFIDQSIGSGVETGKETGNFTLIWHYIIISYSVHRNFCSNIIREVINDAIAYSTIRHMYILRSSGSFWSFYKQHDFLHWGTWYFYFLSSFCIEIWRLLLIRYNHINKKGDVLKLFLSHYGSRPNITFLLGLSESSCAWNIEINLSNEKHDCNIP